MEPNVDYSRTKEEQWSLWILHRVWNQELWRTVVALIEEQPFSKHPQTLRLHARELAGGKVLFLKVFHGSVGLAAWKDVFRESKALRSMRQAAALARADFNVPITVASGEKRRHRLLQKAFLLTLETHGQALPSFLRDQLVGARSISLAEKRVNLEQLATEVRRLHGLGFVHGDLVPTNIVVSRPPGERSRFFFMDNDRTRRYPRWLPQTLWRRNLVQLNRMPLPGITLQDRLRFLKHYLGSQEWAAQKRHWLSWLERKTRQRRAECDAVNSSGSFRRLMRWNDRLS
jgi:serine/threonine protein kinase